MFFGVLGRHAFCHGLVDRRLYIAHKQLLKDARNPTLEVSVKCQFAAGTGRTRHLLWGEMCCKSIDPRHFALLRHRFYLAIGEPEPMSVDPIALFSFQLDRLRDSANVTSHH